MNPTLNTQAGKSKIYRLLCVRVNGWGASLSENQV